MHYTVVGHVDPATLFPNRPLQPIRPLSIQAVDRLLGQYRPEVRNHVEFHDGYVIANWAPCPAGLMEEIHKFAYRLAEQEHCVAAESPLFLVGYPESAQKEQRRTAEALMVAKMAQPGGT